MAIKGNEAKIERIDAMMERSLQFKTLPDGSYVSFDPSSGEVQQLGSAPAGASNGTYGKPPSGHVTGVQTCALPISEAAKTANLRNDG